MDLNTSPQAVPDSEKQKISEYYKIRTCFFRLEILKTGIYLSEEGDKGWNYQSEYGIKY